MKIFYRSACFILLAGMASCQKEIDFELVNAPEKLVLVSVVSSRSPLDFVSHMYVGASQTLDKKQPINLLSDSEVSLKLYENNVLLPIDFRYEPTSNFGIGEEVRSNFSFGYTFTPEQHYWLEAENNTLGIAYAEMTMPTRTPIKNAIFDSSTNILSFEITDERGEDFYSISADITIDTFRFSTQAFFKSLNIELDFFEKFPFDSTIVISSPVGYNTNGYFTDETFDNQTKTIKLQLAEISNPNQRYTTIILQLNHITKSVYAYEKSTSAYIKSAGNPFAEGVQIYTNIVNGYGVFGGSTSAFQEVTIQ